MKNWKTRCKITPNHLCGCLCSCSGHNAFAKQTSLLSLSLSHLSPSLSLFISFAFSLSSVIERRFGGLLFLGSILKNSYFLVCVFGGMIVERMCSSSGDIAQQQQKKAFSSCSLPISSYFCFIHRKRLLTLSPHFAHLYLYIYIYICMYEYIFSPLCCFFVFPCAFVDD